MEYSKQAEPNVFMPRLLVPPKFRLQIEFFYSTLLFDIVHSDKAHYLCCLSPTFCSQWLSSTETMDKDHPYESHSLEKDLTDFNWVYTCILFEKHFLNLIHIIVGECRSLIVNIPACL